MSFITDETMIIVAFIKLSILNIFTIEVIEWQTALNWS